MDVQESGLQESQNERWRSAVAGVLAKSTRRDPADLPPEPERLLDSPTYEGFPIRPLYTSLDALPEPPLPGDWPFVRGGDALRDVKSGWKVAEAFPVAGPEGRHRRQRRCAGRADRGCQRAGAAGRCTRRRRGRPSWTACSRACSSTWCRWFSMPAPDFVAAADAVLPLLTDMDDDQRARLSIDLGADPLTAPLSRAARRRHRRRRRDRGEGHGLRRWRAGDHGRRARLPQPRRQRVVGAGRCRRRGGRLSAAARRGRAQRAGLRCGRSASGWPPTTTSS